MSYVSTNADYLGFDYSSLSFPARGDYLDGVRLIYPFFTHPLVPFIAVAAYWFGSHALCAAIRDATGTTKDDEKTQAWIRNKLTLVHSMILAVYSGWTCYNTVNISMQAFAHYQSKVGSGASMVDVFLALCCDSDNVAWTKLDMGSWVFHFYISKFYEFIDTWIYLLKEQEPSLLQTYHHAGVVIIMWSICVTKNHTCGMILTVLNSGIHTVMYTYYTLAALKKITKNKLVQVAASILAPVKPFITSAQIIQFLVGISSSAPTYFIRGCHSEASTTSQLVLHVYTVILIGLFAQFFYEDNFGKKKDKGEKKKEAKKSK
jgi:hypothetical protein